MNAIHYILKPIVVNEFLNVIEKVIKLCDDEKNQKEMEQKLLEGYNRGKMYEKEKLLLDILGGVEINEKFKNRMALSGLDFMDMTVQMIMIDTKTRFFDTNNESFRDSLKGISNWKYEYLNLNECQSIIFLVNSSTIPDRDELEKYGEKLKDLIVKQNDVDVCIVIGRAIKKIEEICNGYNYIEHMLDYKFFYNGSLVLFTQEGSLKSCAFDETVDKIIESIYKSLSDCNLNSSQNNIKLLFDFFRSRESFSSIYVKYICAEIIKRVYDKYYKNSTSNFYDLVERIYKSNTLLQLEELIMAMLSQPEKSSVNCIDESNSRVIKEVIDIINENYMNDISLEWIADKVYLSPGYLSGFFKKETGQSLIKYITLYRLARAKEFLQNTNMKINDISEKVGYSNTSYFCMAFRNYYGVSPAKFREREV